jgi:S1-C subfamily serine protease
MARIADYLELVLLEIVERPERPVFVGLSQQRRASGAHAGSPPNHGSDPARTGWSTYLGTMPDYAYEGKDGMRLQGVTPGSPAEQGGLKDGDVITRFDNKPVGTIYDFMELMARHAPGDKVELAIKRDGQTVTLRVVLGSRRRE